MRKSNRPTKEEFRITKSDIRAAVKAYNPNVPLKNGLQTIITHIADTLKWDNTTIEETKNGVKKVFHYTYSHPVLNAEIGFNVVLYPSGQVSIADQPVVIGDKVAQLSRMFKRENIATQVA